MSTGKPISTPICDFVEQYVQSEATRFHMPGHKGHGMLGCEAYDITEISGADSLYEASGIIRESERNAASLFGTADTLYSTEGSSQCIRAMLYLTCLHFRQNHPGHRPVIVAGRNVHKAFLTAAALLDFDIVWLWPENKEYSLCRCDIGKEQLHRALHEAADAAGVYLTTPDYLGNCLDIAALADIAHRYGVPLLIDHAHGAYRRFLDTPRHPILNGADICCDSAHKTLPVLTGGAYLHLSERAPILFREKARMALALFGSTSPSYLILQSLDACNRYLSGGYSERLKETVCRVQELKKALAVHGWRFLGDEPLKITLDARAYGYTGTAVSDMLAEYGISAEYADPGYVVLMITPENDAADFKRLAAVLSALPRQKALPKALLTLELPETAMSVREAIFAKSEKVPVDHACGRVMASWNASCPPAVSPIAPGEIIGKRAVDILTYYGVDMIDVTG